MNTTILKFSIIFILVLSFLGCPSTPPKPEKESKPEMLIQIASLNLSNLNKRIERKNIADLASILQREHVEILAVQGITRYPGITTRTDFVKELSLKTDWRNVFGEMVNVSGRQTGNAVFSAYPIISHYNQTFDKIKSNYFEAALQATVDAGYRSLVIISALLPSKTSSAEKMQCIKLITDINQDTKKLSTLIAGNLPSPDVVFSVSAFSDVSFAQNNKTADSKMWYSANSSFQLIDSRLVETDMGTLAIAQIGLFK